jgi:biotin operon repressor BirA-like protein
VADVTERMLLLLSTLQSGRPFSGQELAERLGVSRRTVRRDVDRLRGYGYPVVTRPGPGGSYRLGAGRSMPPLVLDDHEATAAMLGLAIVAASASGEEGTVDEAATRAFGKLDQVFPARLRARLAALRASIEAGEQASPGVPSATIAALADAIAARRVVRFTYRDQRDGLTERRVEPYRHVHLNLRWYLVGWDVTREDWRTFRVDRITDLATTAVTFEHRAIPADTATDYLRAGLRADSESVTVTVHAPLDHVTDALRYQDADLDPVDENTTRVVLQVASWEWLVLNLAFTDADFTIRAGPAITASCRRFADRLREAVDVPPSGVP